MQNPPIRRAKSTVPFNIRDLSIPGFWSPEWLLEPILEDEARKMSFFGSVYRPGNLGVTHVFFFPHGEKSGSRKYLLAVSSAFLRER